jgi:hypothetical protein
MSENQPTTETNSALSGEEKKVETAEEQHARLLKEREAAEKAAKAQQKEMDDFYRQALPLLRKRAEYHRLMAEIPEDILRRVKAEHEHATILAQQREWQAQENAKKAQADQGGDGNQQEDKK